jgi:predicted ATPase/class 3 adenylate cyclase/DNA-binding CsgD family transcriptional regulator
MADVHLVTSDDACDMVDDVVRGIGWPLFLETGVNGTEDGAIAIPTGTVTFLLSDVEGSTRMWERAPEAMAAAIPRHYALLDEAISCNGGVRPLEQGEGDSVVGVFSRASDAVAAALTAQRAFATESWPRGAELRVRLALHTGEAQLLEGRFYLGHALNRCARIRATAHGGQVLVSATTATLVTDQLPAGSALHYLGAYRLKDLGNPERISQLVHPDLPSNFPPLRSLEQFRHNLPLQLTPLIGREREIVEVCSLMAERSVTLTGSAGVGKTRLALAVGAEMLEHFPGGVWWVELAPLADPNAVGRAVLTVLGAREVAGTSVVDQLTVALGDQPCLLLLDNCEHLVESCAELVAGLLAASPSTSMLATSREQLGVPGEVTWRVPSMRCPTPEDRVDVPTLSQYDAVRLFVERARRARPSFLVDDANAPAIADICHRLDGIPLAIELAAARCRQMSAERIAMELDDRFRLLTGGARTVLPRQQTLAASIDWSHDLLDDPERQVFRRLGVFAGPLPLEAAECVAAAPDDVDPAEVFDLVSRLVDKSLLLTDEGPRGETRYRLLESLRAYALERSRAAGELTVLRDAHATWWAAWLEPRGALPADPILDEIEEYHANLRAALDWSADKPAIGLRLLRDLGVAWEDLGRAGDAMFAADRLLTDENARRFGSEWLAAAWRTSLLYLSARGPAELMPFLERIEAVAAERGDDFYRRLARWPKESLITDAARRDLVRQPADRYLQAWVPIFLAWLLAEVDPAAAAPAVADADAVAVASGMRSLRESASFARAELACSTGNLVTAIELTRELLQGPWSSQSASAIRCLSFAALLAEDEDALRCAADAGERALRTTPGRSHWSEKGRHRLGLLQGCASTASDDRDLPSPTCSTLWLTCRESIDAGSARVAVDHARFWATTEPHPRAVLAAVEAAATGDEDRWHDALTIALDQDLRLIAVDAIEGIAVAASHVENWAECLRLVGAARRLRDETGYSWRFAFEQQAVDAAHAAATAALGADAAAHEAEGRDLNWRDAAAYASRARGERTRPHHGWAGLTPTEHRVVALVAEGLTNPEIAKRLLMGRATVKTHLEHIFTKLAIHTRAELAAQAATRRSQEPLVNEGRRGR